MKCSKCQNVLDFPESVLKQLKLCPFCQKDLAAEEFSLKKMIEQKGMAIFSDENASHLNNNLLSLTESERLLVQLFLVIDFPQKLYRALEESDISAKNAITEAVSILEKKFSIPDYEGINKIKTFLAHCGLDSEKYIDSKIQYDEPFTDERDGNVYKTVNIGGHIWMAENFRYKSKNSYAHPDETKEKTHGRFYIWADTLESCPPGWHVPNKEDLESLVDVLGKSHFSKKIKDQSWDGQNSVGFSLLNNGGITIDDNDRHEHVKNIKGEYYGDASYFWGRHQYVQVGTKTVLDYVDSDAKRTYAFSVRYVKGRDIDGEQEDKERQARMEKFKAEFEEERRKIDREIKAAKGECFITTAVCDEFGKPDDCYELQTLRNFRDNWLRKEPDGENLIKEYYATAPEIVKKINARPDRTAIYKNLNEEYIQKCISLIENGEMKECKKHYMDMVKQLKNKIN